MRIEKPDVAVLIPTYNAEKFIEECLNSVLGQKYLPIQIVVCDDASSDNTLKIVKKIQKNHPKLIEIIEQKNNVGIPKNFNIGLEKIETDFVSIIAGDDVWHSNKLSNEVSLLNEDIDCVYSACAFIDDESNYIGSFKRKFDGKSGDILFEMLMHEMAFRSPLLKMKILQEIGYYNENFIIYEDWELKIKYVNSANVAYSKEETNYYRQHPNGISKLSNHRIYYENLKLVYENVEPIINKLNNQKKKLVNQRKKTDLSSHLYLMLRDINENYSNIGRIKFYKELFFLTRMKFMTLILVKIKSYING